MKWLLARSNRFKWDSICTHFPPPPSPYTPVTAMTSLSLGPASPRLHSGWTPCQGIHLHTVFLCLDIYAYMGAHMCLVSSYFCMRIYIYIDICVCVCKFICFFVHLFISLSLPPSPSLSVYAVIYSFMYLLPLLSLLAFILTIYN